MRYVFIFIGLILFFPSTPVQAVDYAVSPLLIEHDIAPRDMFKETIKISNTTSRPLRLYPTVNAITLGDEGDIKTFVPASMSGTATSVTSWIAVTRAVQEIAPGESIKIAVTIKISPDAVAGNYYAFVGFAEGDNRDQAEALVEKGLAPGVVVGFKLEEKRNEYLRLKHFVIPRFVLIGRSAEVTYDIENVGSVALIPGGEIIFYNSSGLEVTSLPVNFDDYSIAPATTKTFTSPIPELGLIGRRKAFINIEYGISERANVYDTVYFNVIPIALVLSLFFATLGISVILTIMIHKRKLRPNGVDTEEEVPVYIRTGQQGNNKDHDINLKK